MHGKNPVDRAVEEWERKQRGRKKDTGDRGHIRQVGSEDDLDACAYGGRDCAAGSCACWNFYEGGYSVGGFMGTEGIVRVAVATVGILEYAKGYKVFKSWHLRIAMPLLAIGLSLLFSVVPGWLSDGLVSITVAQLGYQGLIEPIKKAVERKIAG